jgi:hypothetical protein
MTAVSSTYLLGVVQEKVRVVRVGVAEDDGRGRHGRRGLAGDVGARVVPVDLVRLPRRRHVLRSLPAVVVRVAVAHLHEIVRQHFANEWGRRPMRMPCGWNRTTFFSYVRWVGHLTWLLLFAREKCIYYSCGLECLGGKRMKKPVTNKLVVLVYKR